MWRVKLWVEAKIRAHKVIWLSAGLILVMPLTKGFTLRKDLPEIQWRNPRETGGGIMKNEMPFDTKLLLVVAKAELLLMSILI